MKAPDLRFKNESVYLSFYSEHSIKITVQAQFSSQQSKKERRDSMSKGSIA
jgi:hypothetical protein